MDNQQTQNLQQTQPAYDENQIQVLEGLEAVRKRPGMYIGSTGERGLHHLVYEIVDNAIDEALAGYCKNIKVDILPGDIISVSDDGRGIPVGIQHQTGLPAVTVVFTVLHAGGKFGGSGYKVSGGLHGVGASVVNALSEWLEVNVYDGRHIYRQTYKRGDITSELEIIGDTDKTGTVITFKPDSEIFTETTVFSYDILLARLREQAFLNAGVNIILTDKRTDNIRTDTMCYEGGISSYVEFLNKERGSEVVNAQVMHFSTTDGDSSAEVALQYNVDYSNLIMSFANNIHTVDGGTHEIGFKAAMTRVFNDYSHKFKLLKDDQKFSGEDVREGLTAVISVKLKDAQFEGQTKAKLGSVEMRSMVDGLVYNSLMQYFEENPSVARDIIDKANQAAAAREAARKAKELVRRKTAMGGSGLPGKLSDCQSKDVDKTEVFIVEGDSAGGSACSGRDRRFQAILPLWGKMLNVEKARLDRIYGNDKLMPVVLALGTGIGEDFDISKLRYGKTIIMADADVDGSHIRTLLLTFFFRFMRPLIEQGHIYLAQPPLYEVKKGKKTVGYAYDEKQRDELAASVDGEPVIKRFKGLGEMNAEDLWKTTMDPENRIILRVDMEDAAAADKAFSILMGDKVEPRRQFIEQNARFVNNLDI